LNKSDSNNVYLDYFKSFKQFGESLYTNEMEENIFEFVEIFTNCIPCFKDVLSNNKKIETTFIQIKETFDRISKNWSILPRKLYLTSIGGILSILMNEIFEEILKLKDIGENESHEIIYFLNYFMKNLSIFKSNEDIDFYVKNFRKFSSLVLILDMRMKDILSGVKQGKIGGISKDQMNHLICALFVDSVNRKETLKELNEILWN
jgi:hypothetical protein